MARRASKQPTDGEMEILTILWDQGETDLGTLCNHLREKREIATTTVATMLKVMMDKGLVTRSGAPRAYVWSAAASREATRRGMVGKLVDRVFDGSAKGLVAHLLSEGTLADDERAEILRMLDASGSDDDAQEGGRR